MRQRNSFCKRKSNTVKYGLRKMRLQTAGIWHRDFGILRKRTGCAVMRVLLKRTKSNTVKYGLRKMRLQTAGIWHRDFGILRKRTGCAVMRVLLKRTGF